MTRPFFKIENVSKIYTTDKQSVIALNNVSLDIKQGEILGLLGQNGAGKTTLSSIIATLHPPTHGDILFEGSSIYRDINQFRKALGFCPQSQNLDPYLTVEENIWYAGRYFLMSTAEIKAKISSLFADLDLLRYAHFKPDALSGGTRQRVLIARALIHSPKIVILDEPTVGLDPDIRQKLWGIIKRLKQNGITVILTTHYLDEAEELSDRICILHKGIVKLITSLDALKKQHDQKDLESIFLSLMETYARE